MSACLKYRFAFLILSLALSLPASAAGLGILGKLLAGSADDVARAAGSAARHVDDVLRPGMGSGHAILGQLGHEADDIARGATRAEIAEFEEAALRFSRVRPGSSFAQDMDVLKQARAALHHEADLPQRTIAYSDDLENIRIKVPGNTHLFDEPLRELARARLAETLKQRFDVADMRVVTLGLADDARVSAREAARYSRQLPSEMRDTVGPLSRLHEIGASAADMAAALKPYQNMTVVLVGHIPKGSGGFFVHTPRGPVSIPIGEWAQAAKKAGVNLLPIGCNSGRFADFGAKGLVNSADVLQRLRQIHEWKPESIGTFLKHLTGDDLVLTVNAMDVQLFSNAVQIAARDGEKVVGQVLLNGIRAGGRQLAGSRSGTGSGSSYGECFGRPSGKAFDECVVRTAVELRQREVEEREREEKAARALRLSQLPEEVARAESDHRRAIQVVAGMLLLYLVVWLAAAFLVPHGVLAYQIRQHDLEMPGGSVFSSALLRFSIRSTVSEVRSFVPTLLSGIRLVFSEDSSHGSAQLLGLLLLVPAILGLPAIYFLSLDGEVGWIVIAGFVALIWISLSMARLMWDALTEGAPTLALSSLMFFAWLAAACALRAYYQDIDVARSRLEQLNTEYRQLASGARPDRLSCAEGPAVDGLSGSCLR